MVRVLIDADDPVTRAGVDKQLAGSTAVQALPAPDSAGADVLLVCVDAVTGEVLSKLRRAASRLRLPCVLVTDHIREADVLDVIECQVVAVVPRRSANAERLVSAVVGAHAGRGNLPQDLLGILLAQVHRLQHETLAPRGLTASGMTPRELDVLRLLADGLNTSAIAEKLSYSERTIKSLLQALQTRHGLINRTHAVAYAIRSGVI